MNNQDNFRQKTLGEIKKFTEYRSNRNKFVYNEFRPSLKEGLIEMLWSFELKTSTGKNSNIGLLPNCSPFIIYYHDRRKNLSELYVTGPLTHHTILSSSQDCIVFGASLKLFGLQKISDLVPVKIRDNIILFSKAIGIGTANSILIKLKKKLTIQEFELALFKIPQRKPESGSKHDKSVLNISKILNQSEGNIKLSEVYMDLAMGSRQLVRNFIAATGLTPKQYSRIIRIKNLSRRLVLKNENQFDLMYEGGFFDQSHYCSEFKKLTGNYPSKFESTQKIIKFGKLI